MVQPSRTNGPVGRQSRFPMTSESTKRISALNIFGGLCQRALRKPLRSSQKNWKLRGCWIRYEKEYFCVEVDRESRRSKSWPIGFLGFLFSLEKPARSAGLNLLSTSL